MNVTFRCPRCESTVKCELADGLKSLRCPRCAVELEIPNGGIAQNRLTRCVVCPSTELYVRKDFPQGLGLAIVIGGFAVSCWTWYHGEVIATFAVLFATAFVDMLLYWLMPDHLVCYHCGGQYRGAAQMEEHGPFSLETHERHRQLASRMREAGAATPRPQSSADHAG